MGPSVEWYSTGITVGTNTILFKRVQFHENRLRGFRNAACMGVVMHSLILTGHIQTTLYCCTKATFVSDVVSQKLIERLEPSQRQTCFTIADYFS